MLTFCENRKKLVFGPRTAKIFSFWRFSQKLSILEYMLLHNSYINVAIAHILVCLKRLYDHQGRSCKKSLTR